MNYLRLPYLTTPDKPLAETNWQYIKYFKPTEFACPCPEHKGKPVYDMSSNLVFALVNLRELINKPIIITSGWRCQKHNAEVGGRPDSPHLYKCAVDITIPGVNFDRLVELYLACEHIGFKGIGFYPVKKIIHIDMSNRIQRWLCDASGDYIYLFTLADYIVRK